MLRAPRILGQIARLVRLCAAGRSGRIGLAYFFFVFCLDLASIQITLRLIAWTADFYNALQKLAVDEAIRQIGVFFIIIAISAALSLVATSALDAPAECDLMMMLQAKLPGATFVLVAHRAPVGFSKLITIDIDEDKEAAEPVRREAMRLAHSA